MNIPNNELQMQPLVQAVSGQVPAVAVEQAPPLAQAPNGVAAPVETMPQPGVAAAVPAVPPAPFVPVASPDLTQLQQVFAQAPAPVAPVAPPLPYS